MVTQKDSTSYDGAMEVDLLKGLPPIRIEYKDIGNEIIQVDMFGKGLLAYHGKVNSELEIEIYTNILQSFKAYSDGSGHNSADIGHHLSLIPTKKYNRKYDAHEYDMNACIVFKKPLLNLSFKNLQNIVKALTSIILGEVFIYD